MDIMDTDKQVSVTKTHTQNLLKFLNSVFCGILSSLGKAVDVLFWALSLKAQCSKPKKTPEGQVCISSKIYFTESKHVKNVSKYNIISLWKIPS